VDFKHKKILWFEALNEEVKELDGKINEKSFKNPIVKDLYYGCKVFFSPCQKSARNGSL
jgi:hypothetical protein